MMSDDRLEPVRLVEDEATGDRFLVYSTEKGLRLDIRYEGDRLWMTQAQIGQLFSRDISTISRHTANVIEEGELDEASNLQKVQIARSAKPVTLYSLDMIISVGYRVSSTQATMFRRWATGILVQFAAKGFVVDAARLKTLGNADRIAELREIVRDIRADEANVYAELRQICSLCQDYDPTTHQAREFFQRMQAKLVYAVTSHTPAEIVAERARADRPNMGLQAWAHDNVRKTDAAVSKNYLAQGEVKELNRLTNILLDIFDDQAELGRLVTMNDARSLVDRQLRSLDRAVLRGGGRVASADARRLAEDQYDAFDRQRREERRLESDARIAELAREAKALPKKPR